MRWLLTCPLCAAIHYDDVIMSAIASQITSLTIVYSIVYSDADQRKHQSSASLAFVRGIHRGPVNSPHKWPVTRKTFPSDDVIMYTPPWKKMRQKRQKVVLHHIKGRVTPRKIMSYFTVEFLCCGNFELNWHVFHATVVLQNCQTHNSLKRSFGMGSTNSSNKREHCLFIWKQNIEKYFFTWAKNNTNVIISKIKSQKHPQKSENPFQHSPRALLPHWLGRAFVQCNTILSNALK